MDTLFPPFRCNPLQKEVEMITLLVEASQIIIRLAPPMPCFRAPPAKFAALCIEPPLLSITCPPDCLFNATPLFPQLEKKFMLYLPKLSD
jgi:hypothetical protein